MSNLQRAGGMALSLLLHLLFVPCQAVIASFHLYLQTLSGLCSCITFNITARVRGSLLQQNQTAASKLLSAPSHVSFLSSLPHPAPNLLTSSPAADREVFLKPSPVYVVVPLKILSPPPPPLFPVRWSPTSFHIPILVVACPSVSSNSVPSFPCGLKNSPSHQPSLPSCLNDSTPLVFCSLEGSSSFFRSSLGGHCLCEAFPDPHHPTPSKDNSPIRSVPIILCIIALMATIIVRELFALLYESLPRLSSLGAEVRP